jgi:hypothetical protein
MHAAAHHANRSIELSPGRVPSPAVLLFGYKILEPLSHTAVELCAQYKAVWAAMEKRSKQMEEEQGKAEFRRAKRANRHRCANVGCDIQSNTGKMLPQCAYGLNLVALESFPDIHFVQVLVSAIRIKNRVIVVRSESRLTSMCS